MNKYAFDVKKNAKVLLDYFNHNTVEENEKLSEIIASYGLSKNTLQIVIDMEDDKVLMYEELLLQIKKEFKE